jgi:DNA repair exonuclease SbcCD ATPase subunit
MKDRPMGENDLNWLRGHMRDYLSRAPTNASDNVLSFDYASRLAANSEGSSALVLVHRAAEVISDIEHKASEAEARAHSLVRAAVQKLELAESRIQSAENDRHAAIREASVKLDEAMRALKQAETRIVAAEARANKAEARLSEFEKELTRIEEAIRTQLVERRRGAHRSSMVA